MRKASLGTLFLTIFLDLLGFGMVIPFLPGVARDLGASDLTAALTGTAYSLMQFLFVPVWGRLSDRVGRRPVLLASIAATVASMALLGFAGTLPLLFAARLFSGAATANIAVAQAYIADVTPPERRARGMGILGMAFGFGFILGPFIGGELSRIHLFERVGALPSFVAAALSLVNLALAAVTLPESLPPEARGARSAASASGGGAHRRLSPFDLGAVRRALALPDVGRAVAINFLLIFWFAGMEQTYRLFTEDGFGLGATATGRLFGLIGVVFALVQGGLIGRLTRRRGEARVLTLGLGVQIAGFLLLAVSPRVAAAPLLALCLASGLIAFGAALTNPSISSYVSRRAAADAQGVTLGTLQSASALGRVLGPAAAGLLYQAVAPSAPYYAGAAGLALATVLALGLRPPSPPPPSPSPSWPLPSSEPPRPA